MSVVKLKENCETSTFSFSFFDLPFIGFEAVRREGEGIRPWVRSPHTPRVNLALSVKKRNN